MENAPIKLKRKMKIYGTGISRFNHDQGFHELLRGDV